MLSITHTSQRGRLVTCYNAAVDSHTTANLVTLLYFFFFFLIIISLLTVVWIGLLLRHEIQVPVFLIITVRLSFLFNCLHYSFLSLGDYILNSLYSFPTKDHLWSRLYFTFSLFYHLGCISVSSILVYSFLFYNSLLSSAFTVRINSGFRFTFSFCPFIFFLSLLTSLHWFCYSLISISTFLTNATLFFSLFSHSCLLSLSCFYFLSSSSFLSAHVPPQASSTPQAGPKKLPRDS